MSDYSCSKFTRNELSFALACTLPLYIILVVVLVLILQLKPHHVLCNVGSTIVQAGHSGGIIAGIMHSKIANMMMWQRIKEERERGLE